MIYKENIKNVKKSEDILDNMGYRQFQHDSIKDELAYRKDFEDIFDELAHSGVYIFPCSSGELEIFARYDRKYYLDELIKVLEKFRDRCEN